jgi:4-hydroxybenzoate polyprenyltransferase
MNIVAWQRLLLVKQTLFGLTWLGASALLPYLQTESQVFNLQSWVLLIAAFISARFSGMCFNSLFDRTFDAKNPRTRDRPLPKGEISPIACATLAIVYLCLFFVASWSINPLCGLLSLAVGSSVVLYSLTKRITPLCHFALGIIYFFGPFCAWAAVTGEISPVPFLFGLALLCSISASDIIYACQDVEFDQMIGLYSIPAVVGTKRAILIAGMLHAASATALFLESYYLDSYYFMLAASLVAFVYAFCYMKLTLGQISYMAAFSRINTLSGLILFIFVLAELLF